MTDFACPKCGQTIPEASAEGIRVCTHCGAQLETASECPACGRANPAWEHVCPDCGEPLTLFGTLESRYRGAVQPYRLRQSRLRARALKQTEVSLSEERFARFEEVDRRRLEAQKAEERLREKRDRITLRIVGIASALLLLALLTVGIWMAR